MAREKGPVTPHLDAAASAAGAITAAVQVKLPPFWPADPDIWFAQVEAQFGPRYAILFSTSPTTRTTHSIQRTCLPEQRRLHRLVHSLELGDKKPTQLLRWMRQLLGERARQQQKVHSCANFSFSDYLPTSAWYSPRPSPGRT